MSSKTSSRNVRKLCFQIAGIVSASLLAVADEPQQLTPAQKDFFENKIRPILSENCYKCHSLEQGKSKGDLTLDTREGLLKGGKDGKVIIPGKPGESMLIRAVSYTDPDLEMPPKGDKLTPQQVADLTAWVKMGAPDAREVSATSTNKLTGLNSKARNHWAYQPVKQPELPAVKNSRWLATPVDAFILAKLEANDMKPNAPASKEALIRRAYYDLIGLPPSPSEVRLFVNDGSSQAFARVVDRLLASPHYGERWGRYWLDTARYSDTKGGENNGQRGEAAYFPYAWTYRDYVINSFNQDKPYDRFIVEQLAADKLPDIEKDKTRLAALGFISLGERFNNPNDIINDRIDVVSKGFLGMTVVCARCHDHKFDPIPTKDYYSLHGVFASCIEPDEKPLLAPIKNDAQYQEYKSKLTALEQENRDIYYTRIGEMLASFRSKIADYLIIANEFRKGNQSPDEIKQRNQMIKEAGIDPEFAQVLGRRIGNNRDPVLGPAKQFAQLSESKFSQKAKDIAAKIASDKNVNPLVAKAFAGANPQSFADVATIYKNLLASVDAQGKSFVAANAKATSTNLVGFTAAVTELLQTPFKVEPSVLLNTTTLRKAVQEWPQRFVQESKFTFAKMSELEITHPGVPARAMAINDAPQPKDSPVFIRGESQTRGPVVPRQFLEILSGPDRKPFTVGSGRLELAQAIASKDNPLTARVIMNRVWMHHFGEGFVPTPDDMGNQSEPPSHPELLDYLAARFMEEGWSIKKMHRLIMLSNTYQQSSDTNVAYEKVDPNNRLLWRANIRRLEFEALRDSLLAFSGKLDPMVGGKPVNIIDEPYTFRRTIYGYVDRGNLPDLMANFDFSDPDMPNTKRTSTVVPQQALFFMNNPMVVDVARKIVARPEVKTAPNDLAKIWALYQIIYQRMPRPQETQAGQEFLGLELREGTMADSSDNNPRKKREKGNGQDRPAANRPKDRPNNNRTPIHNEGERVERSPLSVWEEYAQALLLANESAYVN